MQQASKTPQIQNPLSGSRRLLFSLGLCLGSLIPLVGCQQGRVEALTNNRWKAASFPVENFQRYTSTFGYRKSPNTGSGWEFHRGLDLAAPEGSYIRSWWAGRVTKVSSDRLCGTSITIQSGEWTHVYCHMKGDVQTAENGRYLIDRSGGIQIWQGQQVASGTRIGRVGMTGRTTGPHLHWGLKYGNNYVDPGLVLREMYTQQPTNAQPNRGGFQPRPYTGQITRPYRGQATTDY